MRKPLLILCLFLSAWSGRSQDKITQGADKSHSVRLITGKAQNAVYSWLVSPATGTSTNMELVTDSTTNIVWDGPPGIYTLTVNVIDGNGCMSEQINKKVEILTPGELIFEAVMPSTTVCSDLAGGVKGSAPPHSESLFRVVYAGEKNLVSATFTLKNPEGKFVGLNGAALPDQAHPEVTVENKNEDKSIEIAVSDGWENTGESNVQFTVTLISARTTDTAVIITEPGTDVVRNITVLPKPVIEF
jgi:hypothetical protein